LNRKSSEYLNFRIRQLHGRALLESPGERPWNTNFALDEFQHHHLDLWQLVISLLLIFQPILNDQNEQQCRVQLLLETFNRFNESFLDQVVGVWSALI